ncbi:hypothetical protein DSN97_03245 [Deferribacteraceae bacterium V6Fe1]|nr:hypothetical protein DSN97_03245 [Deferribacteraceae bacterium V6Fe1]
MRMMMALLIVGFALLGSSFYFGNKYFDGKVTDKPYIEASQYDQKKKIINQHSLSLEILNVAKVDDKYKICFTINGEVSRPFPIERVEIFRPGGGETIRPEINIKNRVCTVNVGLKQGYYILKVLLKMQQIVELEKTLYIK